MPLKEVTKRVPNEVFCGACNCKDAMICLSADSTPVLIEGLFALPATIISCEAIYEEVGETITEDKCGRIVVSKVMRVSSQLVLRYNSDNFTDPDDAISTDDISCVSTDSCLVKVINQISNFLSNL